jgi:cbb3-type cytochrome oxidase maturation protein
VTVLLYLIPAALLLGLLGLLAFLWALRSGQFDDLDGAAHRILFDDEPPPPASEDGKESPDGHRRRR